MLSQKEIGKYVHDSPPGGVRTAFSVSEAKQIGDALGISWDACDLDQFVLGLTVELEHGRRDPETDVTRDRPLLTGKIAWAHLKEIPDYYTRLAVMESSAKQGKKAVGGGGEKHLSPGNMLLLALLVAVFIVTWVLEVP
jgi:hypothetical protein